MQCGTGYGRPRDCCAVINLTDQAWMPVFLDSREPVTDMAVAVAGAGPTGYPAMVMAPATVIWRYQR